jgi:hypothetical protein
MVNEYIELWTRKHGKGYCDYVLSRMDVTQLEELEKLAMNIVFDGKTIKNIKLKQEHLSLSIFTFFSGVTVLFSSLFMPAFFKNGSVAVSSLGAITVFISSLANRRALVNIRELEMYPNFTHDRPASSIEEHEIDRVKDELIARIESYTHYAPYACSVYMKHSHIKNFSKLMDCSNISTSCEEEDVEILAREIFFRYKYSQGIKVHKQGRDLSLKKFITGLGLVCLALLCDKLYESSVIPELSESYVPHIVSCAGAFIALHSILWYCYDEISIRTLKKERLDAADPISSEIQVLSTTKVMREEAHCSHTGHKGVFHIT